MICDVITGFIDWITHRDEPLKKCIKVRIIERKLKKYI